MKQFIFKIMLTIFLVSGLVTSLKVDAQTYYRCTGDKVNVRKGPGKNYAVLRWNYQMSTGLQQLSKGVVVKYLGKKQNGFMKIEDNFGVGWVSAQYLTPAQKCTTCNGKGRFDRICPECNGYGCPNYNLGSCDDGYVRCGDCAGVGYR